MIVLEKLPIPPSINKQLASVHGRLIKTSAGRCFDRQGEIWAAKNNGTRDIARHYCNSTIESGLYLKVECFFVLHEDKVFWKKAKTIRKNDQNNKLKSALDLVSRIVGVDDTYFINNTAEKLTCKLFDEEQLIVKISQCKIKSLSALMREIQIKNIL